MTEEDSEIYLRNHGWYKGSQKYWNHPNCHYDCCIESALLVQNYRDEWNSLPWYKKLFRKIFE